MEDRQKLKEYIRTKFEALKAVRARREERWKQCCAFLDHRVDDLHSPVSRIDTFSPAVKDALLTTQRGMAGYMLSPSIRWFRYQTKGRNFESSDLYYGANDWLALVENLEYAVFSNSRFYPVTLEALGDVLIIGTSYEMISDEVSEGRIVYDCYSPFECYIAEDGQRRVDTWFREYKMTADEAVKLWGDDCPVEIRNMVALNEGTVECTFIHAIYPRDRSDVANVGMPASQNKKFASVHYSSVGDQVFKVSGYDEFPVAVHRYCLSPGDAYGKSLVSDNLELIMESNELHRKYLKATAKQVDPMMYVPTSLRGRVSMNPGTILYGNSQQDGEPKAIQTVLDLSALAQRINEVDAMISRMLFADLFNVLMRQDRQRTAYEVQEIKGEGLVLLSAIIGNMQEEKLNPLVLRTFFIMMRNGLLPPPPEELKKAWVEGRVSIELSGPLATQMRQYHQTTGLAQGLQWITTWGQIFPESIVNIDGDEGMRQGADSFGLPPSIIREKTDVDKIKAQQAENQARVQAQQEALAQSQVAKNLGVSAQDMAQAQAASGSTPQQLMQNGRTVGQ